MQLLTVTFALCWQALPERVVDVLHRQGRQACLALLAAGAIKLGQLIDQALHRPVIGDRVVQGQQQQRALACVQQIATQQRAGCQVEGASGFFVDTPGDLGIPVRFCQRFDVQVCAAFCIDQQFGTMAALLQAATQHLVTVDDVGQPLLQPVEAYRTAEFHGRGDVVLGGLRIELFEEPQALLSIGQR